MVQTPALCRNCASAAASEALAKTSLAGLYYWKWDHCSRSTGEIIFRYKHFKDNVNGGVASEGSARNWPSHKFAPYRNNSMTSVWKARGLNDIFVLPANHSNATSFFRNYSEPQLQQRRHFGVGGSYGYNAFFRGAAEVNAQSNVRLQNLPKESEGEFREPQVLRVIKMPEAVAQLRAEGLFRRQFSNPGVSLYHHHLPSAPLESSTFLAGVSRSSLGRVATALESGAQQWERGVATQLILTGRGVKAYFEPEYPHLMVRLGVGVKPLSLKRLAEQYASKAKIFVDKRGTLLTIHGSDKRAVGTLTMEVYRHLKANPYTLKGARIAFHPIKCKKATKQ